MVINSDDEIETKSLQFKALGDKVRLRILALLSDGELCVCDIMEILQLPQSTTSRHLAHLKSNQWVRGTRKGKWMHYRLNDNFQNSTLLSMILEDIAELKHVKRDKRELKKYLKSKKKGTCS